jgi:PAS domain S-box-containing protein
MDIYYAAFESSPDLIICVNAQGKILRINRQAEAVLGYARSELIGAPLDVLVPERFRAAHAGYCAGYFLHPRTRPMGEAGGLTARRKDGSELPVEILLSPASTPHGEMVVAVMRDVTEKRAAEDQVKELLGRLRLASEAAGVGHWTYDEAADRFWCDERCAGLFGVRPVDLPNLAAVRDRIHPEDREDRRTRALLSLEKHGKYDSEFRVLHPDGRVHWIADMGRYLDGKEKEIRTFAGVAMDITERKQAEAKQMDLIRDLQRSLRENRILRGLLPVCSHCKRIRDERGAWQPMEAYIHNRTEAQFSHGICPDCLRDHYSEFAAGIIN